jgi:hypothetical protein
LSTSSREESEISDRESSIENVWFVRMDLCMERPFAENSISSRKMDSLRDLNA